MDRRSLFLALALVGCAPKPAEPIIVTLPPGLSREDHGQAQENVPATDPSSRPASKTVGTEAKPSASVPPKDRPVSTPDRRVMAVPTSPPMPARPKADETHRLGYRIEGDGAIELEGVCRFSESEIACWDGKGADLPTLKSQVEKALSGENAGYSPLSLRYGQKNRIVVVRQEQSSASQGDRPKKSLNLMEVGTDSRYGGSSFNLPTEATGFRPDKPYVSYQVRVISTPTEAKETQMRVMVSEPIPNPPEIALRKGVTAIYAGCRFTVASISKGAPANSPMMMGPDQTEVWTVRLTRSGKTTRPAMFSVQNYLQQYRDAKGKLIDAQTYQKWMTAAMKKGMVDYAKQPYRPVQVMGFSMNPNANEIMVLTNVDPALLKTVRLGGSYQRTVDVTGIPLDPKERA